MARSGSLYMLLALAAILHGCNDSGSPEGRGQRRPFCSGDGAGSLDQRLESGASDGGCPAAWEGGCCAGETLWWCESGKIRSLDCSARPLCGWANSQFYDCNTSGAKDPTNRLMKVCSVRGLIVPDSRFTDDCHGVTAKGCCSGDLLYACDEGQLRIISCARNQTCGWRRANAIYNCGTEGGSDPSGVYPRECPAGLPDGGFQFTDMAVVLDQVRSDLSEPAQQPQGCACRLGTAPADVVAVVLLLCALGVLIGLARRSL
jgi:hypothetical protein